MFNKWFILTETQENGLAFWRWFMKHLPNTGKQTVILGVGGRVNRPRLHVLFYPGKPLVCLGLNGNDKVAMFVVFNLSMKSLKYDEETIHNCG